MYFLAVTSVLQEPSKIPGCSGTRNLQDNLSDLKAQVAANKKVKLDLFKCFKSTNKSNEIM